MNDPPPRSVLLCCAAAPFTFQRPLPVIVPDEVRLELLFEPGLQHGVARDLGHVDGGKLPNLSGDAAA